MSQQEAMSEEYKKGLRWFSRPEFSLIPQWRYRPADKWNASSFYFHWLNVRFWTNIAPQLRIGIGVDDDGGLLRIDLPYSHLAIQFLWFPKSFSQRLWRKGTGHD